MSQDNDTLASQLKQTTEITADSLASNEGIERRRFVRRPARWNVVITTHDKYEVDGRTIDISEKGASINSPADFRKGALVILKISVFYNGKSKELKVLGEVKHTAIAKNGFTLGMFFKDASAETFKFFRLYAESRI
jgi:hypothetical protein|tara:strand:- start:366 stop:773 length:408 start_codon:yes stop_codon:yes gene_type:complete